MKYTFYLITTFVFLFSCHKTADEGMVLIPGGEFFMGADSSTMYEIIKNYPSYCSEDWFNGEFPKHKVYVDSFYFDRYEVTFKQFNSFVVESGYKSEGIWDSLYNEPVGINVDNFPVIGVSWNDAVAYSNWVGKRLPTEAEWEYAAKGPKKNLIYPWGNEVSFSKENVQSKTGAKEISGFPPNGYGIYDLGGNVQEWCNDYYDPEYYNISPLNNPKGPEKGTEKVLRGGAYFLNAVFHSRTAKRGRFDNSWFIDTSKTNYIKLFGFRCAKSLK